MLVSLHAAGAAAFAFVRASPSLDFYGVDPRRGVARLSAGQALSSRLPVRPVQGDAHTGLQSSLIWALLFWVGVVVVVVAPAVAAADDRRSPSRPKLSPHLNGRRRNRVSQGLAVDSSVSRASMFRCARIGSRAELSALLLRAHASMTAFRNPFQVSSRRLPPALESKDSRLVCHKALNDSGVSSRSMLFGIVHAAVSMAAGLHA